MADEHGHDPQAPQQGFDEELDYKSIIRFVIGLIVVTLIVLAVAWAMSTAFKKADEAQDPPPSPLAEARADPIPPGPRLQSAPPRDMDELRAQDRDALTTYGWVDQAGGVARIPVERAMSILAERGLGAVSDKKKEAK
ncbi:MAG TPA: hypothetical protein VK550_01435 [Polyangiaceae bacterium]|nr:hypothetical protein [Polyangiaceae bacterium]